MGNRIDSDKLPSTLPENEKTNDELMHAQLALPAYEELRLVADGIPMLIAHISADLHYLFVNRSYADWLGLTSSEIIGRHFSEILPKEGLEAALPHIKRVLTGEKVTHSVTISRDGQQGYLDITLVPQFDGPGAVASFYVIAQDVTDRKRMEEDLKLAEEKSRLLIQHAPSMIYEIDFLGPKFVSVNDVMCSTLGYTREELLAMNPLDLLEDESKKIFQDRIRKYLAGEKLPDSLEYTGRTKDGRIIYGLLNISFTYKEGKPVGAVVVAHDITERKQIEESLRQSQSMLAQAEKIANIGSWEWDIKSGKQIWSEQAYRIFGEEPGQFVPTYESYLAHIHPDYRQLVAQAVENALSGDKSYDIDYQIVTSSSITRWAHSRGDVAFDENGQPISMVGTVLDITERKKAEEAVAAAHRQIQSIIDNTPAIVYAFDLEERFLMANTTVAELFNSTPEQMIGKRRHEFMPKEDADWHEANDRLVIESGRAQEFEEYSQLKSRSITWLTTKFPLRDAQGRIYAVAGISADITERKQADEALRKSEERYRSLFENMLDGLAYCKMLYDDQRCPVDFVYLDVNSAFERLTGLKDVIGKRATAAIPGITEEHPELFNTYNRVALTGRPERFEINFKPLGIWLSISVYSTERGYFVAVFDNITERKRADEDLHKSEERLRMASQAAGFGTFDYDYVSKALNVSPELKALYGMGADETFELCQDNLSNFFHPRDRPKALAAIKASKDPGSYGSIHIEYRIIRGDGTTRWLLLQGHDYFEGDGSDRHPVRSVGMVKDVTERKRAEEELQKAKDELEIRVEERTAELQESNRQIAQANKKLEAINLNLINEIKGHTEALDELQTAKEDLERLNKELSLEIEEHKQTEEKLLKSKEAAEAATKAKSEFLANMSHEIRTPMNAVIGLTDLLQRTDLNQEQRDYVETIRRSGDSLLSVINNILDFSKIGSGKIDLETKPFDLKDSVEESLNLVATDASKKGLSLSYSIDSTVPGIVTGDPVRLRQILINLLNNAVKFTDKGEVTVGVSGMKLEGNNHEIHFAIKDTGIGIPVDKVSCLFQPFSQVDTSTTRRYGGTGLGLVISKRLVEMMGGRIWAESEMGKGSTFHFTILAAATTIKPASSKTITSQHQIDLKSGQSPALRILLAEDNPVNQKVALQMLRKIGYKADVAANGLEVIQALERQPYDIILMDIQMPEMDGLEAAKNIRERWHKGPTIIAITAYALEGDRDRCLNVGMDDYISKPIQMDELRSKLIKWGTNR